jgi:enoyl-CoA hydratase/carnithine racemase
MPGHLHLSLQRRIATAVLDHPERRNALTEEMLLALAEGIPRLEADGARVLVLRGEGRVFCGGYDTSRLASCGEGAGYAEGEHPLMRALDAIEAFGGVTVAAVNGHVVGGGCLLAMSCDLRHAVEGAKWSIPATKLGVVYPERGVRRLVALIGLGRAMEVLLVGEPLEAREALQWGLYNTVTSVEGFDLELTPRLEALTQRAPLAVRGIHEIVQQTVLPGLDDATRELFDGLTEAALGSDDVAEGLAALAQKRAPEFVGR